MAVESSEISFAKLLQGPGGAMAVDSLLEAVWQDMERDMIIEERTAPIEALIKMDSVSTRTLMRTIDPEVVRMEDWFAIRNGAVD